MSHIVTYLNREVQEVKRRHHLDQNIRVKYKNLNVSMKMYAKC
jgi:hypothetical protein